MKRRLLYTIPLVAAAAAVLMWAYSLGYWRFNYPDQAKYPVRGIDISHHQGTIDWGRIKGQDLHFAYIKATEGGDHRDSQFRRNWEKAAEAGLARGAYHFFSFCKPGVEQARNFLAVVPAEAKSLPPAVDLEFGGNCRKRPEKEVISRELLSCIRELRRARGRAPIIYATRDSYEEFLKHGPAETGAVWIRSLYTKPDLLVDGRWVFWQYANNGRVDGIEGRVDLNVFNGPREDFRALFGR